MTALPYAVPAAAAGLAYLDGRYGISDDLSFISNYISGQIGSARAAKHDQLNIFYVLEEHAQSSRAHHPFILFNGRSWTYKQVYETSLKYGTWLKTRDVKKDEIVAMDFMNSELFVFVLFGLWSIGAKPALINYNLTGKPLFHTIRTSTARLVLVDQDSKDNFSEEVMQEHGFAPRPSEGRSQSNRASYRFDSESSEVPASIKERAGAPTVENPTGEPTSLSPRRKLEIVFFDEGLEAHIGSLDSKRLPNSERGGQKPESMAMLIYTSGTTGLPKPAVMSWTKITVTGRFVHGWLPLKKNSIMYTAMPLYHSSASILGLCATLRAATTLALSKKFSHKTFWPEVRASKATIIQYVGETCRYLQSAPESPLDKKHNVITAFGNGLRPDVWQPFKDRFGIQTICEFYAATEAPAAMFNRSTNSFSAGAIAKNGILATALMGSSMTLIRMEQDSADPLRDPKTGLCQIADYEEPGELLYKLDAANISARFQGYFGNNKATSSKVLRDVKKKGDAYFRSGDLMKWDKENRFWFVDRIGDTFRWKAENVSTAEVAAVVGTHEAVHEANVYGVQIPNHDGRAGCAALLLKNGEGEKEADGPLALPHAQTLKSLAEHSKKGLPTFAVPLFLRVTRALEITGTNKQQKHVLQKEGIDVEKIEQNGDVLFWLKDGTYERFTKKDLERIQGGQVRL
jgi:acyl-CoA synthetase (AMP-forming)/AMP-acid ligase II